MYRWVRILGLLFIGIVLIAAVVNYSLIIFNGYVELNSYQNDSLISQGINISIHPAIDFKWTILFVGLSLIVLSSLLKQAHELRMDNDLTI